MEKDLNATPEGSKAPAQQPTQDASVPDTKAQFEVWLDTLKPGQQANGTGSQFPSDAEHRADFFVECREGTKCQIFFTGVLDLGGFFSGSLRSVSGTLITRAHGRIDADIEVAGKAFIDSEVNGNINATGRVVLNSNAKVVGNIKASALSTRSGAIFEGDCVFVGNSEPEVAVVSNNAAETVGWLASAMSD
jgi:cytoskeletal protein CcmA (bactofilin family)